MLAEVKSTVKSAAHGSSREQSTALLAEVTGLLAAVREVVWLLDSLQLLPLHMMESA